MPLLIYGITGTSNPMTCDQCVFDNAPAIGGGVWTNNVFVNGFTNSGTLDWTQSGEATPGDGKGNFVRQTNVTGLILSGGSTGNYIVTDTNNAPTVTGTVTSAANGGTLGVNSGSLTDSSKSWTPYTTSGTGFEGAGYCVYITGGTGAGQCRAILQNTATTLYVLYPWRRCPTPPAPTRSSCKSRTRTSGTDRTPTRPPSPTSTTSARGSGRTTAATFFSHQDTRNTTGGYTYQYNILLPSASRDNSFDLVGVNSNTNPMTFLHNTVWVGGQGAIDINDGATTIAGKFLAYKSNIAVCDPTRAGAYFGTGNPTASSTLGPFHFCDDENCSNPNNCSVTDAISPANADYNGRLGLKTGGGSGGSQGYNIHLSAAPDTHGVAPDPQFVDNTADCEPGPLAHGYSSSSSPIQQVADALAALKATPTLVGSLTSWVRAGWAPTNSAYHGTAHDGTDIGAVAYSASMSPTSATVAGPSSGTLHVASGTFTVTLNAAARPGAPR